MAAKVNVRAGSNGAFPRGYYIRMTVAMWEQITRQVERDTKRTMYPVSVAKVVRRALEVGLERMEGSSK